MKMTRYITAIFFATVILFFQSKATTWTTIAPGSIYTYSNWSNGSISPTTFATPGDTWIVTMAMTMSSGTPWTVGTPSAAPVTVNLTTGSITGSSGGFEMVFNIYGNMNVANTISSGGGGCKLIMNIWGNYNQTAGAIDALGGACILKYNVVGNFTMSGGSITATGGGAIDTIDVKGNFSMSGTSSLSSVGGGATGYVYLSLPSSSGTMMINNTSTGSWSLNSVRIMNNCTAQLSGNFGFASPNTLTVDGTIICPSPHEVNGVGKFDLSTNGTLIVGHATGINGAITCTGTRVFPNTANYGFNGTVAQVTGTDMPASLIAPDTIMINNSAGVTLSQPTVTTGTLKFVNGVLYTGAGTMTVPGYTDAVIGAGLGKYVNGTLVKTIAPFLNINYEVGDTSYAPMLLALSTAGTAGSISVKVTNGLHPNMATSGFASTNITTHYWTIANIGASGPATVLPTATYNLSTIAGGSNNYFRTQHYDGVAWLGTSLASANTSMPYTTTPGTIIPLASLPGDYIFGRLSGPTLGVGTADEKNYVSVYPNPNNGVFTLVATGIDGAVLDVIVTDVLGKVVKRQAVTANVSAVIDMHGVPGIYSLNVTGGNGVYNTKIVVE